MPDQDVDDPKAGVVAAPIVHQACGVLMARREITIDEAVACLYETARVTSLDVTQLADRIVSSTNRLRELLVEPPHSDAIIRDEFWAEHAFSSE